MKKRLAVYPGSFDPVTYGHLDIIQRGLEVFDHLIIAVAGNSEKSGLFTFAERLGLLEELVGDNPRVQIETFQGLLVDYVVSRGASVIIRGLRAVSDFEYEFQLAQTNRAIHPEVETIFMMTSVPYVYLSSSVVKTVASLGGPVDSFVPPPVKAALQKKFTNLRSS
ncbi:Phosphopantetheine adenylyltransferase [Geoalkalibacter ferrihydriticus]|uniref:Phosphopantetheine adenylyltransferase n=2 Tax=Geoalkalibacter ferrihydriticus TaxID=392333 RepID=A0A0C2HXB4_9BACT|nr:pantetheine-phosphate adenylyltransferase [Geoalkalibacter ferrihydriticus]KIH77412.1 phosphopantetheine adenylyltransferase [Geoalkalibacter ferrihydriticus DSM 17813]SDM16181.1 Phosphopantetheine adenylyltransferase [Geoalkalibacter ferrihydriticus]